MNDSVGVVIPLHNKGAYIRRAVESVLGQSFRDFKLTVVDDGSTDDGAARVERIADPRVRVVRTECRGPGAARNLGMRLLGTEWVALLDADDLWMPTFLEKTIAATRSAPQIVAVFTEIKILDRPYVNRVSAAGLLEDYHAARLRFKMAMTSSSVLLRTSAFVAAGGFREDIRYAEDTEAWFRLSCRGPFFYVAEPLSEIERGDPRSITHTVDALGRAAGLRKLLDTYDAYQSAGKVPAPQALSCRRFMQHQRGRLALHLFSARQRAAGARVLFTGVPFGSHTWREYVRCARLACLPGPCSPRPP